jgi:hypothetical protein
VKGSPINIVALFLIATSAVGCSAVRLVETASGIGVAKTTKKVETRKTNKLSKTDVQITLDPNGSKLGFRLEYQPYYKVKQRKVVTHTPTISKLDLFLGIVEVIAWVKATPMDEEGNVNWDIAETWQEYTVGAIILDTLLYFLALEIPITIPTLWHPSPADMPGAPEWISNQPYRIDLPEYSVGKTYVTGSGNEKIDLSELISSLPDPSSFINEHSIDVRASTTIDGRNYEKTVTISGQDELQAFHSIAVQSIGIDMVSTGKPRLMPQAEASVQWARGKVQAGEKAILQVTVRNTGKGELYRVTATTASSNLAFNDWKLEFGRIDPGESKTLELAIKTNQMMRTQDLPIRISFAEYNGYEPPHIDTKLRIVENPRPKFF